MAPSALAKPGNLDRSFGKNGRVIGGPQGFVDMATLTNGRIVVATENTLYGYRPNGRPDAQFGDKGAVVPHSPEGAPVKIEDLTVDGHGRILVVGSASHPSGNSGYGSFAVIERYLPTGELDDGFGSNGVVFTDLGLPPPARQPGFPSNAQVPTSPEVVALGVAVDSRERIILSGTRATTYVFNKITFVPVREAFVARLTEAGSSDLSFGETGTTSLGELSAIGRPAIDSRDGVYFVAQRQPALEFAEMSGPNVIGHLDASGSADLEFGKQGWRTLTDSPESDLDVALDHKGRLLILGQGSRAGIGRFKPSGSVDRSFGRDGVATIVHPKGEVIAEGPAVTRSGSILVVGSLVIGPTSAKGKIEQRILLTRLTHEGKPARRFGTRGTVVTRFGPRPAVEGRAVLVDGNGHALVGGNLEHSRFVLAQYLLGG